MAATRYPVFISGARASVNADPQARDRAPVYLMLGAGPACLSIDLSRTEAEALRDALTAALVDLTLPALPVVTCEEVPA